MTKEDFRRIIFLTVVLTVLLWVVLLACTQRAPLSLAALELLGTVITVITFFWVFFFRWGWRLPLLQLLLKRPYIGGTWIGTLDSNYISSNSSGANELEITLIIRQSALFTHVTTFTSRMTAHSYTDVLILDEERGVSKIIYLYSEKSHVPGVGVHQGTAELTIIGNPPKVLDGEYWTNQKTAGTLRVSQACHEYLDSFEDAKRIWPKHWSEYSRN
jgi:hypothetical protein